MYATATIQRVPPIVNREYEKLKKDLKRSTLAYGSAIASSYFITMGAEEGLSVVAGSFKTFAYLNLLGNHVDTLEPASNKQLLAPLAAVVFETVWNGAPFAFDFDYGATFVGFLAYKMALCQVLYDVVRDWLITVPPDADP